MFIEERFFILANTVCQLLGRWLPPPRVGLEHISRQSQGLDAASWTSLIEDDLSSIKPALPWLEALIRAGKVSVGALSEATARHCDAVYSSGGLLVPMTSETYPFLLRHVARPPHCLSVLGNADLLTARSIAVIGSRRASSESLKISIDVGRSLGENGWVVVSGGAIGCDIAAHEGVLQVDHDGPLGAVVVFAGGLSSRFPRCNERVFSSLIDRGGLMVSERLWFQDVLPRDFPSRNRIVSGMCSATIVMAAALRSGSMITAQEALEQGRDVFVFDPGGLDVRFDGSRTLIAEGALAFSNTAEVIEMTHSIGGTHDSESPWTCQTPKELGTFYTEPNLN